jgi:hypothetical protein
LGQDNPNESKENQGKSLAFPWIPLAESGLSNGLQRIPNKKISCPALLASRVVGNRPQTAHSRRRMSSALIVIGQFLIAECYSRDFCLIQEK